MNLEDRLLSFKTNSYADSLAELLKSQKKTWELCFKGYDSLKYVRTKTFEFESCEIKIQFNPGRLTSSSAKVDAESIRVRKCFLCIDNLPPGQKGILYNEHYIILCNPFPIFPEHFTIPLLEHKPQAIPEAFNDLLSLAKNISPEYLVFYNGPKCGASAPDHLHFQAGNVDFMPIVNEYPALKENYGEIIFSGNDMDIIKINDSLRKLIVIEGTMPGKIEKYFQILFKELEKISPPGDEPMMNIIAYYRDEKWIVIIILREKHRPDRYFEEGENNILLSPASVDLGGVCITPLEKDFNKITKDVLADIFHEVILNDEKFLLLTRNLSKSLLNSP